MCPIGCIHCIVKLAQVYSHCRTMQLKWKKTPHFIAFYKVLGEISITDRLMRTGQSSNGSAAVQQSQERTPGTGGTAKPALGPSAVPSAPLPATICHISLHWSPRRWPATTRTADYLFHPLFNQVSLVEIKKSTGELDQDSSINTSIPDKQSHDINKTKIHGVVLCSGSQAEGISQLYTSIIL